MTCRAAAPTTATHWGADALNIRVRVPGLTPADVRARIERLGAEVLSSVRSAL